MSLTWKDVAGAVGKAAPILGTMIGGPFGAVVGGLVSSALGVENNPDSVSAALASDPAAAEKLAEVQINAKVQLQQLQADMAKAEMANQLAMFQAEAADRQGARQMSNAPDWWIRPLIVVLLVIGACVIVTCLFLPQTRDTIKDPVATGMLGMVFGYWFKELGQSLAFYFGTTKDASDTANKIANFAVAPGAVTLDSNGGAQ